MRASVRVCVFIYLMCEMQLEREFAPASSAEQSHTSPSSAPFRLTTAPFAADGHEQQQGRRKPGMTYSKFKAYIFYSEATSRANAALAYCFEALWDSAFKIEAAAAGIRR